MDIVERLRQFVELEYVEMNIPTTMAEAADEIERLRNVVENWRELVGAKVFNEEIIKMKNDEIERLREALQSVLDSQLLIGPTVLHDRIRGVVYAALQQKESE